MLTILAHIRILRTQQYLLKVLQIHSYRTNSLSNDNARVTTIITNNTSSTAWHVCAARGGDTPMLDV